MLVERRRRRRRNMACGCVVNWSCFCAVQEEQEEEKEERHFTMGCCCPELNEDRTRDFEWNGMDGADEKTKHCCPLAISRYGQEAKWKKKRLILVHEFCLVSSRCIFSVYIARDAFI